MANLTKDQKEAIDAYEGPYLVIAGPGSGKTFVVTSRIVQLINKGVKPESILSITFTNKAAQEMRNRLREKIGGIVDRVAVSTIHRFCINVLTEDIDKIDPSLVGFELVTSNATKKQMVYGKLGDEEGMMVDVIYNAFSEISAFKNAGFGLSEIEFKYAETGNIGNQVDPVFLLKVWSLYEKEKAKKKRLDFDDILLLTKKLFDYDEDVLEKWQNKYKFILVDEFQDTNAVQADIIFLLAEKYRNIFVVGDPMQSIYEWRGAVPDIVGRYMREFSPKEINLYHNFRSSIEVVDVSNKISSFAGVERNIISALGTHGEVYIEDGGSNVKEHVNIAANYIAGLLRGGVRPDQIAVLCRTNAQLGWFERKLLKRRIPYQLNNNNSLFLSHEVRTLMAWYTLIEDWRVGRSTWIVNFEIAATNPPSGLGKKFFEKVEEKYGNTVAMDILLNDWGRYEWNLSAIKLYDKIKKIISNTISSISDILIEVVNDGYMEWLGSLSNAARKIDNVNEFIAIVENYGKTMPDSAVVNEIRTIINNSKKKDNHGVVLSTIHAAKGLEFDSVIIPFIIPEKFPPIWSNNIDEELRVFYVAATRAKRNLMIITYDGKLDNEYWNS